jgi:glycosyltransferase involved in cell wall biosynthesis
MKILISTGIYPPDIGGPAQYAKNLFEEFAKRGFDVEVVTYGRERKLPSGLRHLAFFLKIFWRVFRADKIILLDTMSAGVPTMAAAKLFGKKAAVRIGGDFLWESYVERTHDLVPLDAFYSSVSFKNKLTSKENFTFKLTGFVLRNAAVRAFTTEWQKKIWENAYETPTQGNFVISNFVGEKLPSDEPLGKAFLWAGRPIFLKNTDLLKKAFEAAHSVQPEITLECLQVSHEELQATLSSCYAVIVPSISEISPNLILDAIRHNKPFIVTKYNGLNDIWKDAAVLVDPLSIEDIEEKVLWLSDNANYVAQMDKIKRLEAVHSWKQIADEFLAIFKDNE